MEELRPDWTKLLMTRSDSDYSARFLAVSKLS
jgi:hypothetical protein